MVFDYMLIGYYLEKGDFPVIGVMAVELSTFVDYAQYLYLSPLLDSSISE